MKKKNIDFEETYNRPVRGFGKLNGIKAGDIVCLFICIIVIVICLVPMIHLFAKSFSGPQPIIRNEVVLIPKDFNLKAYEYVFGDPKYLKSFGFTGILTVVSCLLSLVMTTICAYPLIFPNLKGRGIFNMIITITMFFGAGTIPNYLLMKDLAFLDNPIVLVVPYCLSVFNMIILRNFFYGIPDSLREAAEIDGASYFRILWTIYVPLSKPVYATLALFYAVGRWNGYSDALMYIKNPDYFPIQLLMYNIINNISNIEISTIEGGTPAGLPGAMKAAVVVFATVPILCIYPWLQKYFIHGATMGAVKE